MVRKEFVKKKVEVEDSGKRAVYKPGGVEEVGSSGNVFLVGLPLSGRAAAARSAAELLGMRFVDAREPADAGAMEDVLAGSGQVVAVGTGAMADASFRERLAASGKVFYLMADVPLLMSRMENREGIPAVVRAELARDLNEFEPAAMSVAHFILQAAKKPGDLAEDIKERLALLT